MLVLPVTAAGGHMKPAIFFNDLDRVADLHDRLKDAPRYTLLLLTHAGRNFSFPCPGREAALSSCEACFAEPGLRFLQAGSNREPQSAAYRFAKATRCA